MGENCNFLLKNSMIRPHTPELVLLVTAVFSSAQVQAQENSSMSDTQARPVSAVSTTPLNANGSPQKIQIVGEAYDPRRDDTASKVVVNNEEMMKYGDTSISEVLRRVPGITVTNSNGRGAELRMRGLGNGYTQILLNGERVPAGFSVESLSPSLVERIEVLRTGSAEYSTGAIAGTINIILKKVIRTTQREFRAGAAYSSDSSNPFTNFQFSDKVGTTSYTVSGDIFRNDSDKNPSATDIRTGPSNKADLLRRTLSDDDMKMKGLSLTSRVNWNLKNGDTTGWQTFIHMNESDGSFLSNIDTLVGPNPIFDETAAYSHNRNVFARTDLTRALTLASGAKLETKLGLNGLRNTSEVNEFGNQMQNLRRDSTIANKTTEAGFTTTGKYSRNFARGHALSMGWEGGISHRDESRVQRDVDLPGTRTENTDEEFSARVKRLALFAQDEWNISTPWSMYAGIRWEGIDTTSEGNTFSPVNRRDSIWSPIAQTLYKFPNKRDQLRFALTRSYKAPSAANLIPRRITSINNGPNEPDRRGNPMLEPELATGIDASYEHYWAKNALFSASASVRRISDYIRQDLQFDAGRWVVVPVNDGNAETRSVELEAKFPLSALLDNAPSIEVRASVSRNWSRVDSIPGPDNRLDQQTPLSSVFGADYKSKGGQWGFGGSFSYKRGGEVRTGTDQLIYQNSRRDLDMYTLWKFSPKYQLRFAVANLLRQDIESSNIYLNTDGVLRRAVFTPGTVKFRLTFEARY